jgi:hypothetical protein
LIQALLHPFDSLILYPGFDVSELSENGKDDVEGLEATATYVASLLATEPSDGEYLLHL